MTLSMLVIDLNAVWKKPSILVIRTISMAIHKNCKQNNCLAEGFKAPLLLQHLKNCYLPRNMERNLSENIKTNGLKEKKKANLQISTDELSQKIQDDESHINLLLLLKSLMQLRR